MVLYDDNLRPSREMAAVFGGMNGRSMHIYGTSPEMYDVLSVLAPGDAVFLLSKGKDSAEEVREFLSDNSLDHLLVDNSGVIKEAMKRRIPATSYLRVCDKSANRLSQETLLDAAEAHGSKGLREYDFYLDIMRGYTTLKDIKAIGISRITKNEHPNTIREYLWDIHKGEADYTLKDLKSLVQRCNEDEISVTIPAGIFEAFGMKFTLGLKDFTEASDMMYYLKRQGYADKDAKTKALVQYFDAMIHERKTTSGEDYWENIDYEDCLKFHAAGIDPKTAWVAIAQEMTVEQVLGIQQGIAPSVSGGWL